MNDHYFTKEPKSELRITEFSATLRGKNIKLFSGSGVFSIGEVDKGTRLLAESAIIKDGWKILDLGSGYGPIGISLKKAYPGCEVTLSEVNKRAIMLAKRGAMENNVSLNHIESDSFENIEEKYDTIILNPPMNAGRDVCLKMIKEAKEHLRKGGLLQIVARHRKGGKFLESYMEDIFGNVRPIAKSAGFRVYVSELAS